MTRKKLTRSGPCHRITKRTSTGRILGPDLEVVDPTRLQTPDIGRHLVANNILFKPLVCVGITRIQNGVAWKNMGMYFRQA